MQQGWLGLLQSYNPKPHAGPHCTTCDTAAGAKTHCGANDSDTTKSRQSGKRCLGQVHCSQNILSAGGSRSQPTPQHGRCCSCRYTDTAAAQAVLLQLLQCCYSRCGAAQVAVTIAWWRRLPCRGLPCPWCFMPSLASSARACISSWSGSCRKT